MMKKKNQIKIKTYAAGTVLFSALLGYSLYSGHSLAKENEAEVKKEEQKEKEWLIASRLENESESQRTIELEKKTVEEPEFSPYLTDAASVEPYANLNTGFSDSFKELTADEEVLHIHTKGKSSFSAGISAQYKQEIFLDHEISAEFFSTPNFHKYIHGTVTRPGTLGAVTKSIEKDVWGKKVTVFNSETMNYDNEGGKIVYKTPNYTASLSGVTIETDVFIDLGQWRRDTDRLVERQTNYMVRSRTSSADWITIGEKGSIISVVNGEDILDSWIENPVEDTTLFRLEEDPAYFYGNGLQDEVNEHATDYLIELSVNGQLYKEVEMEKDGTWEFDFGSYLNDTDVVSARVKGTERSMNNNGVTNVKYSDYTYAVSETDIIPWEDWEVNQPSLSQAYAGEFIIQGTVPSQNRQLNRQYKLSVTVNGTEIYNKESLKDDADIVLPYLSGLIEGDVIEAQIIGCQDGYPEKESHSAKMVVISEDDEGYEDWEILAPEFMDTPVYEGETSLKGVVPVQNRAAGRTYDLEVYVNQKKVLFAEDIDVSMKPYKFEAEVEELAEYDEVTARIVGHQDGKKDKEAEKSIIVSDATGWETWIVNRPRLNEVTDTDTLLTGNLGEQDTAYGRNYKLEAYINGLSVGQTTAREDGSFSIRVPEDIQLAEGDEAEVEVIGLQQNKEEKRSEQAVQVVTDASHYEDWVVNSASVNELHEHEQMITGHVEEENLSYGRTYYLSVRVNGNEILKETVESNADYAISLPAGTDLQENDQVAVQVIGHQTGKEDKYSGITETAVMKKIYSTTSKFEKGYWESFGLVYEGLIENEGWDLSDLSRVTKTANLIHLETGAVINGLTVQNTDWYEAGRYNGYQMIIDNSVLGSLPEGNYVISMSVAIDGAVVAETELTLKQRISRMGPIHDKYEELEEVVILGNRVKPEVMDNKPMISIEKNDEASLQLFNKYWNKQNQLVFDGFVQTEVMPQNSMKKLIVTDADGEAVFEKNSLSAAPTSWGAATNISDEFTFQAIIPQEYTDQSVYSYWLTVFDETGNEWLRTPLN